MNNHKKKIDKTIKIEGKYDIKIRLAKISDMRRIQVMYAEVYGADYSIPLVTDKDKMREAIEDDFYYWLVAESNGRIIASLVYVVDENRRISKALGAVVSKEYRKHDLAYTMMKLTLNDIIDKRNLVDLVYATTRTSNYAPQKLTESLGFLKLGIFPNTHKVHESETHCLTAYYTENAFAQRKLKPKIIPEILPFYNLVQKQMDLEKAEIKDVQEDLSSDKDKKFLDFEVIKAAGFIKHRFAKVKNTSFFKNVFMPFHEPNLMFVTPDQSTEVYLTYSDKDKYSVILGGITTEKAEVVLESVSRVLNEMNMAYVELVLDAYTPELQRKAMLARFIPSGYFPCAKKTSSSRRDCVVFSRTFETLDFRNVRITSVYRNFLSEYIKLWKEMYIDLAFKHEEKRK